MLPLLLGNCMSLRSAKGLSKGELAVGYMPPFSGSLRYGVIDNLEVRGGYFVDYTTLDIFLHTNSENQPFNAGVMLGRSFSITDGRLFFYDSPFYYGGITIERQVGERFAPYVSYTIHYLRNIEAGSPNTTSQLSFGSRIDFRPFDKFPARLMVIPEVSYFLGDGDNWFFGLNTSIAFDMSTLFGHSN